MKLSIGAELVYDFAQSTQIIASLEASQTSDQVIISESLDVQPPARLVSDKTPYGERRIRASLSGEVTIRYRATVENNRRQLLHATGRQHLWSDLPSDVLPFLLPSRFCPSDKFMRFAQREFGAAGDDLFVARRGWIEHPQIAAIVGHHRLHAHEMITRRPGRGVGVAPGIPLFVGIGF